MPETAVAAPSNTVILSDGRLVVMRETTGFDEDAAEEILAKSGVTPDGFGFMRYIRFMAINCLERVGDKSYTTCTTLNEYKLRLMDFKSPDMQKILELYNAVNGKANTPEGN